MLHLDSSAFFADQLRHILTETYKERFTDLRSAEFIPVSNEVPMGARHIIHRSQKAYGRAKIIANGADDLPTVNKSVSETPIPVWDVGTGFEYTVADIDAARLANRSLSSEDSIIAREFIEREFDEIACIGDDEHGFKGALNDSGVTLLTAADAGGGATEWTSAAKQANPLLMVKDVMGMTSSIAKTKLGRADTVVLPTDCYDVASTTHVNDRDTVLDRIKRIPGITTVDTWDRLDDVGAGGKGRILTYKRDPKVLRQYVVRRFEQLSPQHNGLKVVVPCWGQTAGAAIKMDALIRYLDGAQ